MKKKPAANAAGGGPQTATETATAFEGLSPAQSRVLVLMLEGNSIPQAAKQAGRDRSTVYKWLREDPQFLATYQAELARDIEPARATMQAMRPAALATMADLMADDATPAAVRARIAETILDRTGLGPKSEVTFATPTALTAEDEAAAVRFVEDQLRAKGWKPPTGGAE